MDPVSLFLNTTGYSFTRSVFFCFQKDLVKLGKIDNVFSLLTSLLHTRNKNKHTVHSDTKWKAPGKWILKTGKWNSILDCAALKHGLCSKWSPLYCFGLNMLATAHAEPKIRFYFVTQPWNFLFLIGCSLMLSESWTTSKIILVWISQSMRFQLQLKGQAGKVWVHPKPLCVWAQICHKM